MPGFRSIDAVDLPPISAPPRPLQTTVLGVAVGDLATQPSLCAVRYDTRLVSPGEPLTGEAPVFETHYLVLGAERLPAGTSYPEVATRVNVLARRLYNRDSRGDYHVLVDASDVGRPVVEAIRDSVIPHCHVTAVTVTPGDAGDPSILWRNSTSVGLLYLVSRLQAILQGRRLHAPRHPAVAEMLDMLGDYELHGDHGPDLVRALALAVSSEYQPVRYGISPDALPAAF